MALWDENGLYNHMFKFYSTYIKWMYMVITCKYGDVAIIYQSMEYGRLLLAYFW